LFERPVGTRKICSTLPRAYRSGYEVSGEFTVAFNCRLLELPCKYGLGLLAAIIPQLVLAI